MSDQSGSDTGPQRRVIQRPGVVERLGARLELVGLPGDASAFDLLITRDGLWLSTEGWRRSNTNAAFEPLGETADGVMVGLSDDLVEHIPVGARLQIAVPAYGLSDTIIWRMQPKTREQLAPAGAKGRLARRTASALPKPPVREANAPAARATTRTKTGTRNTSARQQANAPSKPPSGWLLLALLGLIGLVALVGLSLSGVLKWPTAISGQGARQAAGTGAVAYSYPGGMRCQASRAQSDWDRQLEEQNANTAMREGLLMANGGNLVGARPRLLEAACASADVAWAIAEYFDPTRAADPAVFGEEGRKLAIEYYRLSLRRWGREEAALRAQALEAVP